MQKLAYKECETCEDWNGNITNCMNICGKPLDALEEFNQYRSIGTLEECREIKKQEVHEGSRADIKIFTLDDFSWYAAHNLMEFLQWYHKYVDSIETADDLAGLRIIEPEDGTMWSDENITQEDIDTLGESDECCRGGIGDLKRRDGVIFKMQTFADVLGDEDIREPYEIASINW